MSQQRLAPLVKSAVLSCSSSDEMLRLVLRLLKSGPDSLGTYVRRVSYTYRIFMILMPFESSLKVLQNDHKMKYIFIIIFKSIKKMVLVPYTPGLS